MLDRPSFLFSILTLNIFLAFGAYSLLMEGTFFDALVYSSIARNMSELSQSFWSPHYFFGIEKIFYEHPPLQFWLHSHFFDILGDHLWSDRLFSFVIFVMNLLIMLKIWVTLNSGALNPGALNPKKRTHERNSDNQYDSLLWLPVLLWISTPLVFWSYPITLLENTLILFTGLSALFFLKYKETDKKINRFGYFFFYVLSIAGAFLVKGPVGLFPLAFPVFYGLFFHFNLWKKYTIETLCSVTILILIFGFIFIIDNESYTFLKQYFGQQVLASLKGIREAPQSPWKTLFEIFNQNLLALILGVLLVKDRKLIFKDIWNNKERRRTFFFLASISLSASLPLIISPKQRLFYIAPSIFFYSLCFALLFQEGIKRRLLSMKNNPSITKKLSLVLLLLTFAIGLFLFKKFGSVRRDHSQIEVTKFIRSYVPVGSTVSMKPKPNWSLISYLQRYHKITTTVENSKDSSTILIAPNSYRPNNAEEVLFSNKEWTVYKRRTHK